MQVYLKLVSLPLELPNATLTAGKNYMTVRRYRGFNKASYAKSDTEFGKSAHRNQSMGTLLEMWNGLLFAFCGFRAFCGFGAYLCFLVSREKAHYFQWNCFFEHMLFAKLESINKVKLIQSHQKQESFKKICLYLYFNVLLAKK